MGPTKSEWLRHYGNSHEYRWRRHQTSQQDAFIRPLGLVEFSFDADARYYEGRSDMCQSLELEIKSKLRDKNEFRERILLAWTLLRCQHLLLRARTFRDEDDEFAPHGLHFVVDVHKSISKAIEDAGHGLVFLADHYESVDYRDFFTHIQNGTRVLNPSKTLSKCFVLPMVVENGRSILRFQFVLSHQIADGLSGPAWMVALIKALNSPVTTLKAHILQFGFGNPLQRRHIQSAVPLSPIYSSVLDYTKTPPFNTKPLWIHVSKANTQRLHRLVREAKASVGAGIYALAALCMMEFYEEREPDVKFEDRKSFITGFPLNPRAFFGFHTVPDSMMLAFSDGIALPFLPSTFPFDARLRLLARQAQRQLSAYQKRAKPKNEDLIRQFMTSRGAGLVLANQYIYSLERADSQVPVHLRKGVNVQGSYPPRLNPTMQTCGVSSVGNRDLLIKSGEYDLSDDSKDFIADYRNLHATVRARPGEFLVGIAGTGDGLVCSPSVDITTMDPVLVERWKDRFEHALDEEGEAEKSKL